MWKQQAIKEGIKEGKLEVAKKLISLGADVNMVIQATEFTEEEIRQLLVET